MTTLEKIRAEFISRYPKNYANEPELGGASCVFSLNEVLHILDKYAEQEPCDDAISREELLKAIDTWDKFGCNADTKLVPYQDHYIPYIHYDDVVKCIKGMPSVRQKPIECDEVVSRQAVLDVCKHKGKDCIRCSFYNIKFIDERTVKGYCTLGKAVRELPSVRPQEQTGHWIWCVGSHKCSNCEEYTCFSHKELLRYCPNCGARMFEPQESEVRDDI